MNFFHLFRLDEEKISRILDFLKEYKYNAPNCLSLCDVTDFILKNEDLLGDITNLRISIINKIIQNDTYIKINNRMKYYSLFADPTVVNQPTERCDKYLYRKLFTFDPPPYYFNYHPPSRDIDFLYKLRQRYGYSNRMNCSSLKNSTRNSTRNSTSFLSDNSHRQNTSVIFKTNKSFTKARPKSGHTS